MKVICFHVTGACKESTMLYSFVNTDATRMKLLLRIEKKEAEIALPSRQQKSLRGQNWMLKLDDTIKILLFVFSRRFNFVPIQFNVKLKYFSSN